MAMLALCAGVSGCASKTSYMGIAFDPAVQTAASQPSQISPAQINSTQINSAENFNDILKKTDTPLSTLARLASGGDKHAQLELGIRFEEGRGVERDLKKAKKLYGKAASGSGGQIWVYSPPVGNSPGRVIPLDTGPKQFGLAEAKRRLERLNAQN